MRKNDPTSHLINTLSKQFPIEFIVSIVSLKSSSKQHIVYFVNYGPIQSKMDSKAGFALAVFGWVWLCFAVLALSALALVPVCLTVRLKTQQRHFRKLSWKRFNLHSGFYLSTDRCWRQTFTEWHSAVRLRRSGVFSSSGVWWDGLEQQRRKKIKERQRWKM